ncbi:hypothetical protein [Rhodococcus sp. UFZ-B548]|uniref:hypothetical protein n=1 Tax=Rhodococcus sp. UFZ-B548 TaxID=2742212 RepID=UPI00217507F3|nr:hypothetical protein [Rhodococcus sp. UFZ-B548]
MTFDSPGVVRQCQSRSDDIEVSAQTCSEGSQRRFFTDIDCPHPGAEVVTAAVGHDLGELSDQLSDGGQGRTASQERIELCAVVVGEPVRAAGQPAGDLPDRGCDRWQCQCCVRVPQRLQVAADSLVAAAITQLHNFPGEPGCVGAAGMKALVQIRFELVEQAGAGLGRGQELLNLGGSGEASHRSTVERKLSPDRRQRHILRHQLLYGGVAFAGPHHQTLFRFRLACG